LRIVKSLIMILFPLLMRKRRGFVPNGWGTFSYIAYTNSSVLASKSFRALLFLGIVLIFLQYALKRVSFRRVMALGLGPFRRPLFTA